VWVRHDAAVSIEAKILRFSCISIYVCRLRQADLELFATSVMFILSSSGMYFIPWVAAAKGSDSAATIYQDDRRCRNEGISHGMVMLSCLCEIAENGSGDTRESRLRR
jgi:hypothetical protein